TGAFVAVFMLLGLLFVSNLYTLSNLNSARQSLTSLQRDLYKRITTLQSMDERLSAKFSMVEDHHAERMDALKRELDAAAGKVKSTQVELLDRARSMVQHLQSEHQREVSDLKKQIGQKANNEAVVLLSRDVSEAKADASQTQRTASVLAKDLAVARSEVGDVIGSNHDDLDGLHRLSDRDTYQFALTKDPKEVVN